MSIQIPPITEEALAIFQREVQEHDTLPVSDWQAQSLINRIRQLEAALKRLDEANDTICRLRTSDQYLSMIDGGQKDALYELDEARFAARKLFAA